MKKYANRNEVPAKYKWDLEFLLEGKTIAETLKKLIKLEKDLIVVKDSRYKTEADFIKSLKLEDKASILGSKLSSYLSHWTNENLSNPEPNQEAQKFSYELYKLTLEKGPEAPRIFANEGKILKYLKNPALKSYVNYYTRILETKSHQLPKNIQEYRNKTSRGDIEATTPFMTLTDSELIFKDVIDSKGKKHVLNHSTFSILLQSKDAKVRKDAVLKYQGAYISVKQTLSNLLFQHFKNATIEAKIHKFKSTIDYLVYDDRSSEKLLLSLYEATSKNAPLVQKSKSIHKKIYKAKYGVAMTKYDSKMPLVSVKTEYTIEQHKELVLKSLKPFGTEYYDAAKVALNNKWIDFASYPGKMTGAYSAGGSYGIDKKLILMNDDGSIRSTSTLAHELGHSMHSYFSDKNNHQRESQYKIFVAEIASIFNELMLFDHILEKTDDDKLKLHILQQKISGFEGTVFRQVEFSNYEYEVYKGIEDGKPLSTFESLSEVYRSIAKKYSGKKNFTMTDEEASTAIRVPHYYYGFYVYKYAIGQICANIFFNRYKVEGKESLQKYIKNFLSMGSKMQPIELMKHNGIDLEDAKTYEDAFKVFEDNIIEWNKVAKKIYKNKFK